MLTAKRSVLAFLCVAAAVLGLDAAALSSGVCYSPWHHDSVTSDVVQKDLTQVKQYFSGIRTYHASFSGVNVVDAAASAGLKVAVGIMMSDKSKVPDEIEAAVAGAIRHPDAVEAIYVGNENLQNSKAPGFGSYTVSELVAYIQQVKQKLAGTAAASVKVGSVQRYTEWKECDEAKQLAAASDIIGVNMYPFFSAGTQAPIDKMNAQWSALQAIYAQDKLRLTESGWPRAGSAYEGNQPSQENAQSFFNAYLDWSKDKSMPFYFMMYDLKTAPTGQSYEQYFGLADIQGTLQIQIPAGTGTTSSPTTPTTTTNATTNLYTGTPAPTPASGATQNGVVSTTPVVLTPAPTPQSVDESDYVGGDDDDDAATPVSTATHC